MSNLAYETAHADAVLVDHNRRGTLKITGATRLDLIHRMTTQNVNPLQSGEGAATVFTTDIGRIIDRTLVYASSDTLYVITGDDHADPLARYLMRNIFFNDDIQVADISAKTAVWGVYGPRAGELLADAGFPDVDLPMHHWRQAELNGDNTTASVTAYLHRTDPVAGDGYLVTCQMADANDVRERLVAAGIVPIDEDAYEYLRIESGLPRFGQELTLDYIPLEANLWDDVSFHKGCYIGQEIIARMESRGKLAKRLVALRPSAPVEPGSVIMAGDREAGTITSAADGLAGPVALGYVKTAALEGDSPLSTADGTSLDIAAELRTSDAQTHH
ncbi:MAG: glycine cleavage system protein T [Chloroflexota bacterium]